MTQDITNPGVVTPASQTYGQGLTENFPANQSFAGVPVDSNPATQAFGRGITTQQPSPGGPLPLGDLNNQISDLNGKVDNLSLDDVVDGADRRAVSQTQSDAVAALATAGNTGTGAFIRASEVVGLPLKGDIAVGAGGGAAPVVVSAPSDGAVLVADSTQTGGWNSSYQKAAAITAITIPSRGTADSSGLGVAITADAAGSGGTGNHDGGDITLAPGAKAGTGRDGRVQVNGVLHVGSPTGQTSTATGLCFNLYGSIGTHGQMTIFSNDASADGRGGMISLGGENTSGGPTPYTFGIIRGVQDGAGGAGVYSGRLELLTTASNSARTIRVTINSTGVVKIVNLAGTGSRAVVADENGVLSAP